MKRIITIVVLTLFLTTSLACAGQPKGKMSKDFKKTETKKKEKKLSPKEKALLNYNQKRDRLLKIVQAYNEARRAFEKAEEALHKEMGIASKKEKKGEKK